MSEKRGPSTPLAPKAQNKRQYKFETKDANAAPFARAADSKYEASLMSAQYKIWMLEREVERQKLLTAFLLLERDFS